MKDFDSWNGLKKKADSRSRKTYVHPREVWRCMVGINIGSEIDGKHENFERPVLVMKVYNKETLFVLPITSREKRDRFHVPMQGKSGRVWVKLTQGRVISSQRLLRKVDVISQGIFENIRAHLLEFI